MKSMRPPLVVIFFMTYFHRAGGRHGPLGPPGIVTPAGSVFTRFGFNPVSQRLLTFWDNSSSYSSRFSRILASGQWTRHPMLETLNLLM